MNRALGIDHGDARIGLAISDDLNMMAHPLKTLLVKEGDPIQAIVAVAEREKIGNMVIGIPRNMDGTYGPAAEKVRAFAAKLRAALRCPLHTWDERMSTQAAQRALHEAGRNVKNSRAVIDQVAAVHILQGWLDSQALLG